MHDPGMRLSFAFIVGFGLFWSSISFASTDPSPDSGRARFGFDHAVPAWPGQPGRWSFRDESGGKWIAFDVEPSDASYAYSGEAALAFVGEENSLLVWEQQDAQGVGMVQFWIACENREAAGQFSLQFHDGEKWTDTGWSLDERRRTGYRPHTVAVNRPGPVRLRWLNTGREGASIFLDDVHFSRFGERLAVIQFADDPQEDPIPRSESAPAITTPLPRTEPGTLAWLIRLLDPGMARSNYVELAY